MNDHYSHPIMLRVQVVVIDVSTGVVDAWFSNLADYSYFFQVSRACINNYYMSYVLMMKKGLYYNR